VFGLDGSNSLQNPACSLSFTVNMIHLNRAHLSCLTGSGHNLRGTLFPRLQVYKTRADIQSAPPLIKDGVVCEAIYFMVAL
jgi:hypothetical protein